MLASGASVYFKCAGGCVKIRFKVLDFDYHNFNINTTTSSDSVSSRYCLSSQIKICVQGTRYR